MVSVLQIHVTQAPGDILVFLTGQVSPVCLRKKTTTQTSLLSGFFFCSVLFFLKAALVYCRKRSRPAVSFCRRDVGGLAQRSLSSLCSLSMPTCPQTCKLRFLTPHHLELARYFSLHFLRCLVFVTKRPFDPDHSSHDSM